MEASLKWRADAVYLGIPAVSLTIAVRAIRRKAYRMPGVRDLALFGFVWMLLVIAGTFSRDVMLIIITLPLVIISFAIAAVLWSSWASRWNRLATTCFWVGALAVISGAVHFGLIALDIQCIRSNCHGQYNPPHPNVARELFLWSLPTMIVCLGLELSKQFGKIAVMVTGTLLLLLNPTILWMVAWLQPPLGM